jgi:hypothetical protein
MKRVLVTIEGATPILFNRLPPEELLAIRNGERKKKRFKAVVSPREECEKKVYVTKDGYPYVPGKMIWACLVNAGRFIKLDGKTLMSTATTSRLAGFITIEDHAMKIFDPTSPEPDKEVPQWEVDLEQGRNPNGGEVVCIIRPRFDIWAFKFNMLVDVDQIEMNKIRNLIDIAGTRVGLGDFRPQRKGTFGKFVVKCWQEDNLLAEAAE